MESSCPMLMVRGGSVGDNGVVIDGDGSGGSVGDDGVGH